MAEEINVKKLAELARLQVADSEVPALSQKLKSILGYVERLNSVDVTGVAPMSHVNQSAGEGSVVEERWFRADVMEPPLRIEAMLQNVPSAAARFIKVPIIIEQSGD